LLLRRVLDGYSEGAPGGVRPLPEIGVLRQRHVEYVVIGVLAATFELEPQYGSEQHAGRHPNHGNVG
jgi:hypothetical protein